MKNIPSKIVFSSIIAAAALVSCNKDLNRLPANAVFSDSIYSSPANYKLALANVYGGYTLTGTGGPSSSDIAGVDAGTSDFVRCWWNTEELTTNEAVCAWGDPGVPDFHNMNWSFTDPILIGLYARCGYQITLCNDFITHCTPAALQKLGVTGADATSIAQYAAEA